MDDRAIKFPALHKILAADRTVNYRGYQIDLSEHSGGWWYNVYPPGGEKNIGGVLSVPFDRADQAERSAKQDVDQHALEYGERAAAALGKNSSIARILAEAPFEEPTRDETDDEDGSPAFMDKKAHADVPALRPGVPQTREENLPVSVKRDLIKDLYGGIGEKMFGFSPKHIQWMHGVIDKIMSDQDVTKEWEFIRKGNVEKILKMMMQMQNAGPEDAPELEEMQGLWDSIAEGILRTKQAHKEISQDEWDLVEDSLMGFVDRFTDKLEKKADKALPLERKRLGSALTEKVVASFFLPRVGR